MAAKRLSNLEFVKASVGLTSIAAIAAATGLSETTVQQKRVQLRKAGWDLPELPRGVKTGGAGKSQAPTVEELTELAKLTGKTLEELQLASVKNVTVMQERSEKIKAGQAKAKAEKEAAAAAAANKQVEGESNEQSA